MGAQPGQPGGVQPAPVQMSCGVQAVNRRGAPYVVLQIATEFGMVMPMFPPEQARAIGEALIDAASAATTGLILPGAFGAQRLDG